MLKIIILTGSYGGQFLTYFLLLYLLENKGSVLTRKSILEHVWGDDLDVNDRVVDNTIRRLRESLAEAAGQVKSGVVITNVTEEKIENTAKLKQAFVKGSSSRGNKGTGLGLAIADNNLAMLGYKLELKTEDDKFTAAVKM